MRTIGFYLAYLPLAVIVTLPSQAHIQVKSNRTSTQIIKNDEQFDINGGQRFKDTFTQVKEVQPPNQLISNINFRRKRLQFKLRGPQFPGSGIDSLILRADKAMARRNYRKAEDLFREILQKGPPKRHEYHLGLGITLLARYQSQLLPLKSSQLLPLKSRRISIGDAISEFERALELEDDYPPALRMLSKAYESKGSFYRGRKSKNKRFLPRDLKRRDLENEIRNLDKTIENYQKAKSYFDKFTQLNRRTSFISDRGDKYTRSFPLSLVSINSKLAQAYLERGDKERQKPFHSYDKILEDYQEALRSLGFSLPRFSMLISSGDCRPSLVGKRHLSRVHENFTGDFPHRLERQRKKTPINFLRSFKAFKRQRKKAPINFSQSFKAFKRQPLEAKVRNKLAIAYTQKGDIENRFDDKVSAYYCKALLTDDTYAPAYLKLGQVFWDQGKKDTGIKYYERAVQIDNKYAEAYLALAAAYNTQGNQSAAAETYVQLFKVAPNTPNLASRLPHAHLEKLANHFRLKLKYDSRHAHKYYYYLGYVLYWQGDYHSAIENYNKSISSKSNAYLGRFFPNTLRAQTFRQKGMALSKLGKHRQAIESINHAMDASPSAIDYYSLGEVLVNQGIDLERAIASYSRAIEINKKYALAYNARGQVRVMREDWEGAKRDFISAIESDEEYTEPYNNLGQLYQRLKQFDQAIFYYEKALSNSDHNYAEASDNHAKATAQLESFLDTKEYKGPTCENCDWFWLDRTVDYFDIKRSVVRIYSEASGIGSGWVIKKEGNRLWIVTNRHVVSEGDEINVDFFSDVPPGRNYLRLPAYLGKVTNDDGPDLALLVVDNAPGDIEPLKFTSDIPQLNASVYAIGHPNGIGNDWSLSQGSVSSINNKIPELQIDASLGSGNSGGPLLNENDQVIGIMAKTEPSINDEAATAGFGYAIPMSILQKTLYEWGIVVPSR